MYDKELPGSEHVMCAKVHSNGEERSLKQMIALMNGDLNVAEANNLLRSVTEATNNNTKALAEVIKRMGQLSDAVLATRKKQSLQICCASCLAQGSLIVHSNLNSVKMQSMSKIALQNLPIHLVCCSTFLALKTCSKTFLALS